MGELYHGSSKTGIQRLDPHKSTHGTYVYATPDRELAVIFSARCGDDCTYALYRRSKQEPWQMVERIPEAFSTMFDNSASIYTLDDATFKDIHTGFSEVVSETSVFTKKEEFLPNVYEEIKKMAQEGKIQLYTYPNKPKEIPQDNSDLIDKQIRQEQREHHPVTKKSFERIIFLHPNLIEKVNQKMKELGIQEKPYQKEDLISLYEKAVLRQAIYPEKEQYLRSSYLSTLEIYPELSSFLQESLSFLKKPKEEQIETLFEQLSDIFKDIPEEVTKQTKQSYLKDPRSFSEIGKEIMQISEHRIRTKKWQEDPKNQEIFENSVVLIGSIEEKKNLSKILSVQKNMSEVSFSSDSFRNLSNPSIVNLAIDSEVYEHPLRFYELKEQLKPFKNIELLLPRKNIEESVSKKDEPLKQGEDLESWNQMKQFLETNQLSQLEAHTYDLQEKSLEQVANEMLNQIEKNSREQKNSIKR